MSVQVAPKVPLEEDVANRSRMEAVLATLEALTKEVSNGFAKQDERWRDFDGNWEAVRERQDKLEARVSRLERRIDYLENQSRRNNLVFHGIAEDRGETWEVTEAKLRQILLQRLGLKLGPKDIERAHRKGNRWGRRPIVAKFVFFKDREAILRERRRMPGVWVEEDFSERVQEERRFLKFHMFEARKQGSHAVLRFDKLVLDGRAVDRAYLERRGEQAHRRESSRRREEGEGPSSASPDQNRQRDVASPPRTRSRARRNPSRSKSRGRSRSGSRGRRQNGRSGESGQNRPHAR